MILEKERELVIEYGKKMIDLGITVGTFGNISIYNPEENLMAISPSGMDYFKIDLENVVVMTLDGEIVDGNAKPSSEYDMHRIMYQKRKDIRAVIHTHSTFATTLACMHEPIEPIHYVIAYSGRKVPCIPYVQFGTYELAQAAYEAMGEEYNACLLGNHGLLCCGPNISYTLDTAQQVEFLAQIYYYSLLAGKKICLSDHDLEYVLGKFGNYRQK